MAATVTIRRWTGSPGGPTKTDITGINTRVNAEDAHTTAGTNNPVQVPEDGINYSYWMATRLSADTSPSGTIDNIRWYTDGSNNFGTGVAFNVGLATTYIQASGDVGESGEVLNDTNYTSLTTETPSNAFSYTEGSPLSVAGDISNPSTGDFGNFVVGQFAISDTAGPGATSQETFTFKYDET